LQSDFCKKIYTLRTTGASKPLSEPKIASPTRRVARWFILKQKNPNWVNFKGLAIEDVGRYVLWPFVLFYSF
jgi:hypothetical protein